VAFVIGVFVAVLLHELGHALTARAFGAESIKITLFGLGGLTQYPAGDQLRPGQQFVISAAGSAVGMMVGGAVYVTRYSHLARSVPDFVYAIGIGVVLAGLMWGALNWLPILPLDGGNMARFALAAITPKYALRIAKALTVVTAAAVIYLAITRWDNGIGAIFVAFIALQGLQMSDGHSRSRPRRSPGTTPPGPRPTYGETLLSVFDDDPHK